MISGLFYFELNIMGKELVYIYTSFNLIYNFEAQKKSFRKIP
jgi:hypothetical protein